MTVCNMSIEGGARAGLVAPDEKTFAYLKDRPKAPKGAAWDAAVRYWETLRADEGAHFDSEIRLDAANLPPIVTWGTCPEDVVSVQGSGPEPGRDRGREQARSRSGAPSTIWASSPARGSPTSPSTGCSSAPAPTAASRTCAPSPRSSRASRSHEAVNAMIVPGSGIVKMQAEAEGLDQIFKAAGFDWREPGCSMCLAMNADRLAPQERCASTSNRNFEGRQGFKGRTHLVSPAMAAAAAIAGRFVDVRTSGRDRARAGRLRRILRVIPWRPRHVRGTRRRHSRHAFAIANAAPAADFADAVSVL